jgi:hypothetical protein
LAFAVIVVVPAFGNVAAPLVADGKFTIVVSPDIQVTPVVTGVPDNDATKTVPVLPTLNVPHGLIVRPVGAVTVAVLLTPLKVAVIVTAPPLPTAMALPGVVPLTLLLPTLTVQGAALVQVAEVVTSLVLLSLNVAVAIRGCDPP